MMRRHLPHRRVCITQEVGLPGWPVIIASVGLAGDGSASEIFLRAAKPDSQIDQLVDDAAVAISLALQHGARAADLAKSVARRAGTPSTPIGQALDIAATIDAESEAP